MNVKDVSASPGVRLGEKKMQGLGEFCTSTAEPHALITPRS